MKNFLHVFYTWLIAVLFSLTLLLAYDWLISPSRYGLNEFFYEIHVVIFVSYVVTLPALVLGIIFFYCVIKTNFSAYEKLYLWLLSALAAVALNILIVAYLFGVMHGVSEIFRELWTAFPGVMLAIAIRHRQFIRFQTKPVLPETGLV